MKKIIIIIFSLLVSATCFAADDDASLSQQILDIAVALIEPVKQPDGIGEEIWRESVAFEDIHGPILPVTARQLVDTARGYRQFCLSVSD